MESTFPSPDVKHRCGSANELLAKRRFSTKVYKGTRHEDDHDSLAAAGLLAGITVASAQQTPSQGAISGGGESTASRNNASPSVQPPPPHHTDGNANGTISGGGESAASRNNASPSVQPPPPIIRTGTPTEPFPAAARALRQGTMRRQACRVRPRVRPHRRASFTAKDGHVARGRLCPRSFCVPFRPKHEP